MRRGLVNILVVETLTSLKSVTGDKTRCARGSIQLNVQEVEIESIRKMLARAAGTGLSNTHNA